MMRVIDAALRLTVDCRPRKSSSTATRCCPGIKLVMTASKPCNGPPEIRTPRPVEALACSKYLTPQLHVVSPQVFVALGRCAAQALGVAEAHGPWRGRWAAWEGIPVMPTYHPAFLLRSPEFKRTVWEDLQLVMQRLGKTAPKRS